MNVPEWRQASDLLLASCFYEQTPERSPHSFTYRRPGQPNHGFGMGMEVNYDDRLLATAIIFLRRNGAPFLRTLSVSDVRTVLLNFMSDNFWTISSEAWGGRSAGPFSSFLTESAKQAMAQAMAASKLFKQPRELTLFPLTVIECRAALIFADFFLVPPSTLTPELMKCAAQPEEVNASTFPPFVRMDMPGKRVSSWLGVWAANYESAKRMRATILGALSLLPHHGERYLFTGREVVRGGCTLHDGQVTISFDGAHTPALSQNLILDAEDQLWLDALADKMGKTDPDEKRRMRALEYHYRAWVPDPVRRFPSLFGALDAIYGDAGSATQAVVDAVGPVMGPAYDMKRLKLLLGLRASVIHGGAPNVYESSSYHRYYKSYLVDANQDLELIVARCLQSHVFGTTMTERPHTHAELVFARTGRRI